MPTLARESKRLLALQSKRTELLERMEVINDEAGDEVLNEEQSKSYAALEAELEGIDLELTREQKRLAKLGEEATVIRSVNGDGSRTGAPKKEKPERDPKAGFATPREYLLCVMRADSGHGVDPRLKALRVGAAAGSDEHQTQNDSFGGYLVPEAYLPNFLTLAAEPDPISGRTTMLPMAAPVINMPARVDKNHSSSVCGGLTFTRRMETGSGTASRMQMEKVRLEAHSLMGLSYASEEVLVDSAISFIAMLEQGFRDQLNYHMIDERLNGSGAGEYLGILNAPCTISVAKEGGQAADTFNITNLLKMRARVWRYDQAIWMANHDMIPQLATLALASGSSVIMVYQPSSREDMPDMLFGRPIIYTEYCKTLGDLGDIVCANWSQYLEGVYEPLQQAESVHVRFDAHERCFKFWTRNAGAPWWKTALTPKNSTSTLSPFVTLAERS
ncbi:MAG: phage major capsid protein [Thermoanaerobaculia bacterium]